MKQCFCCKGVKPIDDFYVHKMMADGHLGKCKSCVKKAVAARIKRKKLDRNWVLTERARCRAKSKNARQRGNLMRTSNAAREAWRKRNMHKICAQSKARRAEYNGILTPPGNCEGCAREGVVLVKHHPDYSRPLYVKWLCYECHGVAHRKQY